MKKTYQRESKGRQRVDHAGKTPRQLQLEELANRDGIKAQHAAATFVTAYLRQLNNGWTGEETEVGSEYDRQGFDYLLKETATGRIIPVDFSFASKDGAAVQYDRAWFAISEEGDWVFRQEFAQSLFRQFIKVMSDTQHFYRR